MWEGNNSSCTQDIVSHLGVESVSVTPPPLLSSSLKLVDLFSLPLTTTTPFYLPPPCGTLAYLLSYRGDGLRLRGCTKWGQIMLLIIVLRPDIVHEIFTNVLRAQWTTPRLVYRHMSIVISLLNKFDQIVANDTECATVRPSAIANVVICSPVHIRRHSKQNSWEHIGITVLSE